MSFSSNHHELKYPPTLCEPLTPSETNRVQDTCVQTSNKDTCAQTSESDSPADLIPLAESLAGFPLHAGQRQLLDPTIKRALLNCSRQWGKSTIAALKAALQAHLHPDQTILIGGPSGRQSQELLHKTHLYLLQLQPQARKSRAQITLPNRSRVIALPNSPDNIRGYSADLVVLDEAARIPEAYFTAILPTIAARAHAPLLLLSTPAGKRGYFYKAWNDRSGAWLKIQGTGEEATHIDQNFLATERRISPPELYRQEFAGAFTAAANAVFEPDLILATHDPSIPAPFNFNTEGLPDEKYYLGLDFGQRRDHTAYVLLDAVLRTARDICPVLRARPTRLVIRVIHMHRFPLGTPYREIITHLEELMRPPRLRKKTFITADATGVGGGVFEFLSRANLYNSVQEAVITPTGNGQAQYHTKEVAKHQLIDFMNFLLDHRYLVFDHSTPMGQLLLDELLHFQETATRTGRSRFRASGDRHDDLVMSLALAAWKAFRRHESELRRDVKTPFIRHDELWNGRHLYE